MRNLKTNASILILAVVASSFTSVLNEKQVDIEKSTINWTGSKVTGSHNGNIQLKEGVLVFDEDQLTGGHFVVDMTTIVNHDLSGDWKDKLEGHLRSDDFFSVDQHPTSSLKFTEVKGENGKYEVTGDLTIKGITKPVTFEMTVEENQATAAVKIDRTQYDIRYGSASFFDNLKDKAISNDFELKVSLVY